MGVNWYMSECREWANLNIDVMGTQVRTDFMKWNGMPSYRKRKMEDSTLICVAHSMRITSWVYGGMWTNSRMNEPQYKWDGNTDATILYEKEVKYKMWKWKLAFFDVWSTTFEILYRALVDMRTNSWMSDPQHKCYGKLKAENSRRRNISSHNWHVVPYVCGTYILNV